MKYYKINNGVKQYLGNILFVDNIQILNPTHEQIINAGYKEEVDEELSEEQKIQLAKEDLYYKITKYDMSDQVNNCIINYAGKNIKYWANKEERNFLKMALQDCLKMNKLEYRLDLRDIDLSILIPCQYLLTILSNLELYAIGCYNKTTDHFHNVQSLKTLEEINNYDYTKGYPEQLVFEV